MVANCTACCGACHAVSTGNMPADAADYRAFGAALGVGCRVNERERDEHSGGESGMFQKKLLMSE